ncbi:Oligopeptide transporter OPT superfamily protein [Ignisphaera aggregans DSM 17230]|uniref:Oligopeptide transporter OPT superfamily protein n=1 Tax=Ignisphaera aggregans (strain DSM 17230 / JCM 13409 / AQ1.S1) TaxID=583356 RepID=E0STE2_IGNAA|nr:Oligopeptide transporter OPT superfamily protein [Ignisphaera aggregans DSM 17230]
MRYAIFIGFLIGTLMCFIDSYSYAISGYTTAEISLISIPILIIAAYRLLGIKPSDRDVVLSLALAYSMDLTTTLASGMYITYGFLDYASQRLKAFGLDVHIPQELYSGRGILDLKPMSTYISLSIISFSGILIAYTLRSHFLDKERLRYPLSIASTLFIKTFRGIAINRSYIVALSLGFFLQFLSLIYSPQIDLTPISSSFLPGSVLALSFWPILIGIFMLMPLRTLRSLSMSSIITYALLVPLSMVLFRIPVSPTLNYDDALFSITPIVIGINIGVIFVALLYYILKLWRVLSTSFRLILGLTMEKTIFIFSLGLIILLLPIAFAISTIQPGLATIIILFMLIPVIHIVLILVNMRVVGETGTGSQALLPMVTFLMYFLGVRDIGYYAALDPYTGIPMPQVVGASAMNMIRVARFFGIDSLSIVKVMGLGIFFGSLASYIFGNILVYAYGFNSPTMPLTRWIPTIAFIASICNGKLDISSIYTISIGIVVGILVIISSRYLDLSIFPFLVGIMFPPDIGILALVIYAVKSIIVKLGVEMHEKIIAMTTFFIIGTGIAIATNVVAMLILGSR